MSLDEWYNMYMKLGYTPEQMKQMTSTYISEGVPNLEEMFAKNYLYEKGYDPSTINMALNGQLDVLQDFTGEEGQPRLPGITGVSPLELLINEANGDYSTADYFPSDVYGKGIPMLPFNRTSALPFTVSTPAYDAAKNSFAGLPKKPNGYVLY